MEKSLDNNMVALEGLPFNSSMVSFHILSLPKINVYIAKQCSHVEFPYFLMSSHLGLQHRPCTSLSMKEGSLFCFALMKSTESGCFRSCSWYVLKALNEEGCMSLVPWLLDSLCKSS
jgi:hypothetical protein